MDRRLDLYSQLANALGCDEMDSHDGRLATARELRAERDKLRAALVELRDDVDTLPHVRIWAKSVLAP